MPNLTVAHTSLVAPAFKPVLRLALGLVDRARRWPVESQQVARRNAMIAGTALTARRREREEVEELLRDVARPPVAAITPPAVARAHAHG